MSMEVGRASPHSIGIPKVSVLAGRQNDFWPDAYHSRRPDLEITT